jgi:hypothetical protein
MMPPHEHTQTERLAQLEREHAELEASLPAHSIPAAHLIRLEELEEEIAALRTALSRPPGDDRAAQV